MIQAGIGTQMALFVRSGVRNLTIVFFNISEGIFYVFIFYINTIRYRSAQFIRALHLRVCGSWNIYIYIYIYIYIWYYLLLNAFLLKNTPVLVGVSCDKTQNTVSVWVSSKWNKTKYLASKSVLSVWFIQLSTYFYHFNIPSEWIITPFFYKTLQKY